MILMVGVAILLTSCNKDLDLDIKFKLTANIDAMGVVKNLKKIDNSDLFPDGTIPTSFKVRITYLIYNSLGELEYQEVKLLNDFSENLKIESSIKEGEYSIVSCVDVVSAKDLSKVEEEYWRFENVNSFKDCKVKYPDEFMPYYTDVLGYSKQTVKINKSESLTLNLKPVGSLITINFDYLNLAKIQELKVKYITWNDYFSISDGTSSVKELLNDGSVWAYEKDEEFRNLITNTYLLPSNKLTIKWEGYDINGNLVKSGIVPSSSLTDGTNKIITINTNTGTSSTLTKSATIPSDGQVLRIQSLPTRKINSVQ